jgi:hypothetical protein
VLGWGLFKIAILGICVFFLNKKYGYLITEEGKDEET